MCSLEVAFGINSHTAVPGSHGERIGLWNEGHGDLRKASGGMDRESDVIGTLLADQFCESLLLKLGVV